MNKSVLIATLATLCSTATAFAQTGDLETIRNADSGWVDTWQAELEYRFGTLNSAYSLTPEMQEALRSEMQARLIQQYAYEQTEMKKIVDEAQAIVASGNEQDETASNEFAQRAKTMDANMPLNDTKIVAWLEQRLPAAENEKAEYRQRWTEIQERRWNQQATADVDTSLANGRKAEVIQSRSAGLAQVTPDNGEPVPPGEKGERLWPIVGEARAQQATVYQPGTKYKQKSPQELEDIRQMELREKAQIAEYEQYLAASKAEGQTQQDAPPPQQPIPQPGMTPRPTYSSAAKGQPPPRMTPPHQPAAPPAVLAQAPPLDDWDRLVADVATRYGFGDSQRTTAQSILRDLKRRANHYRMSRANDIARAELTTDAKSRGELLREINRPLDALFEELKQRLDSLPTAEQRQKAGAAPARTGR